MREQLLKSQGETPSQKIIEQSPPNSFGNLLDWTPKKDEKEEDSEIDLYDHEPVTAS